MTQPVFLPLTVGRVPGTKWTHRVHDLGVVRVPSGRLEASDPFVFFGDGIVVPVPPGDYPVRVTVADVSDEQDGSHLREAYLSVLLADGVATRSDFLTPEGQPPAEAGEYYGVPVDAGTVGFADAEAARRCVSGDDGESFKDARFSEWPGLLDSAEHLIKGCANIELPGGTGENVVLSYSGWGDGGYPVIGVFDAADRLLAVHIDLQVDEPPGA